MISTNLNVRISICIPSYERTDNLKRLLDSISIQKYRNYEIIVSDDSKSDNNRLLCDNYKQLNLIYLKNEFSLGSPKNWNHAIEHAQGDYIKIMHDDDWFIHEHCLTEFAQYASREPDIDFFFCEYQNVTSSQIRKPKHSSFHFKRFRRNPINIIYRNFIGPPSVTLFKKSDIFYDCNLIWLVDIDYYIQRFKRDSVRHINKTLINVGISNTQITAHVFGDKRNMIKEHLYFLSKYGLAHAKSVFNYDYYWRLVRNYNIKEVDLMEKNIEFKREVALFNQIIMNQKGVGKIIKVGAVSKLLMLFSFTKFLCRF